MAPSRSRDPSGRYLPGGFEPPPDGAPRQVSTPVSISADDIRAAHDRAEAAARDHTSRAAPGEPPPAPVPHPMQTGGAIAPPPDTLGQTPVVETPSGVSTREKGLADPMAPAVAPAVPLPDPEVLSRQPAASSTDSPARGQPRPPAPGKEITGGFGLPVAGAEYFALDGRELKTVVFALADRLKAALDQDLRFGLSVVYPQVRVSLSLVVDGRPPDQRARDQGNTEQATGRELLEWSRILSLDAEVEDSPDTPAGRIRDDFDLDQPGKRIVRSGGGTTRLLVDSPI